jgi:inorganic phosphate transporter, PiT family
LMWATMATLAGSLCALFLAQTLLIKFSGKGLASDELIHSIPFITAVAAGAGFTVILATRLGFPVSTTHALLGALTGCALMATGTVNFSALGSSFVLPLLLSPIVAVLLSVFVYSLFHQIRKSRVFRDKLCVCIEEQFSVEASCFTGHPDALLVESKALLTIDSQVACDERYAGVIFGLDLKKMIDSLHFLSAGAVCFARGLNDTPKITALLLLAPGFNLESKITLIAVTMAIGGLLNARRVAETMSHKITTVSHGQGLSANLTTALLVIFASKLGMPVSTTHVSVGALFGIGLTTNQANYKTIMSILLSWLLTLPCAALSAAGVYLLTGLF